MTNPPIKAVFLDRDGTLNIDINGYIRTPDEFELFPFAGKSVKLLNDLGYKVIVVTNQSGVARGYYTQDDVNAIHDKMYKNLAKDGAKIDKLYYSPYHIEGKVEPFNINSECRKPSLGMFKKAVEDFKLRPEHSWMIGDRYTDIAFGSKAGMKTILLLCGLGKKEFMEDRDNWTVMPDYIVEDLWAAVQLIETLQA